MWPLRTNLASWRRSNPDGIWEDSLREIILSTEERKIPLQTRTAVKNIIERLRLISSGHAECPVPQNEEELLIWWSIKPPE
jgi:hypothetical protein